MPCDPSQPESILRRDIFHNLKVGVLQGFIAGSVVLIAELGYVTSTRARGTSATRLLPFCKGCTAISSFGAQARESRTLGVVWDLLRTGRFMMGLGGFGGGGGAPKP